MNKIEPQAWKHGPERRGNGDNGGKKGKGLVQ